RIRRRDAAEVRRAGGAGRHESLGRPEAAARDRARHRAPPRHLRVRRQFFRARLHDGRAAARRAQVRDRRRDDLRRGAARQHDHRRRPHRRPRRRPGRGHRHARAAPRGERGLPRNRRLAARAGGGGMSDAKKPQPGAPAAPPPRDVFGNRPIGGLGVPTQKAKNFKATTSRLLGYLRPHRGALVLVTAAGAIGTVFSVLGPKILGMATTRIFEGFMAKARGVPGAHVDFEYVGRILGGLIVLYIVANAFQYLMQYMMANIAQRTVYEMRRQVEAKFERLPLKFFDARTHGEVMSRVVNDLDSISSTLQQNLTQLLTSALTLIGLIVMMLTISWILTIVIVVTLPISMAIVAAIAKRSQQFFMKQQVALGGLNGHVAEMYAGHTVE